MHDIEPFYRWLDLYSSDEDELSPYYGAEHSEFEFSNTVYNYYIHPQWDQFGSSTLYLKILFVDYERHVAIIEFLGEWNDALYNDVMYLKREVIEPMIGNGVNKFILLGENVLNFHGSNDCYYEEWFNDVEDGWIAAINFRDHVMTEMKKFNLDSFMVTGGTLDSMIWRSLNPVDFLNRVEMVISHRLA